MSQSHMAVVYNGSDRRIVVDAGSCPKNVGKFLSALGFKAWRDPVSCVTSETRYKFRDPDPCQDGDLDRVAAIVRLGVPYITGEKLEEGYSV